MSQMEPGKAVKRLLLTLALFAPVHSSGNDPASRQEAESLLRNLDAEIHSLQLSLENARNLFANEQRALKSVDLEIQENARQLRELRSRQLQQQGKIDDLRSQQHAYLENLGKRSEQIADQLLAAYQSGRESRLKLILNQDSPARLNRLLAYYEYFSREQADRIRELRTALADLEELHNGLNRELDRLAGIEEQYRATERHLQQRREERRVVVDQLTARISGSEARLAELSRNRADLETLLQRLEDALSDIPADLGNFLHPGAQRGRLPMPVRGRVLHAFGQTRAAGLQWQGWLIEAAEGEDISAIAYGRVAYADWLRGYGLLMIIDHGEGFMSLYGNNESLLYEVGDWVQPGAVISTIGSTTGNGQGLYFELRNNGKAVDPASWLSRR